MKDRIIGAFFSLSGLAITLAVAGFLSALVTMFTDLSTTVPIRALLFAIFIASCLIVILLKVIYDLASTKIPPLPYEHPIKYIADARIFGNSRDRPRFLQNSSKIPGTDQNGTKLRRAPFENNELRGSRRLRKVVEPPSQAWKAGRHA